MSNPIIITFLFVFLIINLSLVAYTLLTLRRHTKSANQPDDQLLEFIKNANHDQQKNLQSELGLLKDKIYESQLKFQKDIHESLSKFNHQSGERYDNSTHRLKLQLIESLSDLQKQIKESLSLTQTTMSQQFNKLNETTENRLNVIGEKVEDKLNKGFEKTSQTFTDIVKRLALIDDAQKKIHDLSSNVVSLQEILQDKRSRGVFGEIQLNHLLENALPANAFAIQYTLPNQYRVDAMLFLPEPTGHIAIDAKFPLDSFKTFTDFTLPQSERQKAQAQFKLDIKKHIQDIASKYIISGETSDGAIMFIPAEAVFAEIHAHFPELVELAYQNKVWLTSPTTMMAILTTASAVLKDSATRKQVHIIQEHLKSLAKDFGRFEKRMDNLSKHLQQANADADQVHTTAKKISSRFAKIERVELNEDNEQVLGLEEQ